MCERCPERNLPNNDICACFCQDVVIGETFIGEEYEYCRTCNHILNKILTGES